MPIEKLLVSKSERIIANLLTDEELFNKVNEAYQKYLRDEIKNMKYNILQGRKSKLDPVYLPGSPVTNNFAFTNNF